MAARHHTRSRRSRARFGTRLLGHAGLLVLALAAAAAAGSGVYLAARGTITPALDTLRQQSLQVGMAGALALLMLILTPLIASALTYFCGWQTVRFFHLARYLKGLHAYAATYLERHASLARLGYVGSGLPFAADGSPQDGAAQPLAAILPRARGTLLLGDDGMGKTTALWQYVFELTRRRYLVPIALGQAPLPLFVPLAGYAVAPPEPGRPRLRYLAAQLRAFGPHQVAVRLPTALQRWNAVVVCDGLDEVPASMRPEVVEELAVLASRAYPQVRLVVSCALNTYLEEPQYAVSLKTLQRVVLTGLSPDELERTLRQARRATRRSGESFDQLLASIRARGLGAQVGHPATLAALFELRAAGVALPVGRARLLGEYASLLCARAGGAHDSATVRELMGWLANTLRARGVAYVPAAAGESAGEALQRWCEAHQALVPAAQGAGRFSMAEDQIDRATLVAVAAGILEWLPDGLGLRFAQPDLAAVFAAQSLASADDGASPLPAALIQRVWHAPLVLWSGFCVDPGDLAARVLGLRERRTLGPTSPRNEGHTDAPQSNDYTALALALAVLLEGVAPALAVAGATTVEDRLRLDRAAARLGELFDRVQAIIAVSRQRQRFAAALVSVERESGCDLSADCAALATSMNLGRVVRAQAIWLLGALGTSSAVDALMTLLSETDPLLRSAVDGALAAAGPVALSRLKEALSSPDELVRVRATEALSQGGPEAIWAALAGLEGPDALQRAAAARVLGTLKAQAAREVLLGRLEDSDSSVRVAAAWALGQIGTRRLIPSLAAHLTSPDVELRAELALALGAIRDEQALPTLVQLLDDPEAKVRAGAAAALGQMGDQRAAASLRAHLADSDPWAQAAAATALRRLEAH